ncbi:MAG: hypothetical protein HPY73_03100 [Methanomassiliicoccales archaeon]|nr:MAG: hypothetical protein HPY73_03100 [Methanomassiliicoccales archaeon]
MADPERKERRPDGPVCDRALMCPEEWEEPKTRKVLGEYHKEGLPEGMFGVDADLERFEEYWSKKGSVNVQSKYHKDGAPYLEEKDGKEGGEGGVHTVDDRDEGPKDAAPHTLKDEAVRQMPPPRSERAIDLATVEVISYALFRAAFANGIRVPIKMENVVDAEITIRGKDIVINTNELYTNIPDLAIWRVIYTHKGKPVFELGRGVKKGLKVHRLNALGLGIALWRQARRKEREKQRARHLREKAPSDDKEAGTSIAEE